MTLAIGSVDVRATRDIRLKLTSTGLALPGRCSSQSATFKSLGNFAGGVVLSCSFGAGPCAVSPSTVTLSSGATVGATATVNAVGPAGGVDPRDTWTLTVTGTYATPRGATATLVVE